MRLDVDRYPIIWYLGRVDTYSFEAIEHRTRTAEAIQRIKKMIRSGRLSAGDRLPPEREMAAQLGLSRNALREAVRALALLNILEARQGNGTYVTSLDPDRLMEPLDFILSVGDATRLHLGEVRGFLEAGAAYLAAKGISDSEILEIEKCLRALKAQMDDSQAFADTDAKFHALVLQGSRNPLLTRLVKSIQVGPEARDRPPSGPHTPNPS